MHAALRMLAPPRSSAPGRWSPPAWFRVAAVFVSIAAAPAAFGADDAAAPPPSEFSNLDSRIQDTKSEVIELNRDLMVLEEELLFPASTQVAVFVSMDVGKLFDLDSVQVKLDKGTDPKYIELRIKDSTGKLQPEFDVKIWPGPSP